MSSASTVDMATIQVGDYIIIQRQKYTKLQKFSSLDTVALLGKEQLELRGLLGQPYHATFKMCQSANANGGRAKGNHRGSQRLHTLEMCSESELRDLKEVLKISASGEDNRDIVDDGESQSLKPEDIDQLREEHSDSTKIIEKIVENSKTFASKTEYSQEKYLKKKEKKYFEFVQIRKPSVRLLAEIFYRLDPEKVLGLRLDTLSKIISYSGVSAYGNYLMYESGSNGLLPAVFLNSIGAGTEGKMVHMHPGNVPQRQGLLAMNFPQEQLQRCISVNIYSVLRHFYQADEGAEGGADADSEMEAKAGPAEGTEESESKEEDEEEKIGEPSSKKPKLVEDTETKTDNANPSQKWHAENVKASLLLKEKMDCLVVAAKEHPTNIVNELLPFVKPSRPIVVFSLIREVLTELYTDLKADGRVTNLHLTSNWWRIYQILPNRTHPEVNMNGSSGYLLTGYTVIP